MPPLGKTRRFEFLHRDDRRHSESVIVTDRIAAVALDIISVSDILMPLS
jgi:hypothetical protein